MKKRTFILMILVLAVATQSFSQNPFESLGVKDIKVLTFSNGKFNEFFDNDSIVQIGSVLFNTKSNEIVAFVQTDTSYSEATLKPEITSRWLSPDPLAAKFPFESPYIFCGDNPINFIDIAGKYKYPANKAAAYTRDYPTLTKYLSSNIARDIMSSPAIMAGLLKYSGGNLTESEVAKATKWKSGPTIMFRDNPGGMKGAEGHYDAQNNVIEISTGLAKQLESASDKDKQAALYGAFTTVTHETVHYGDYLDGVRQSSDDPSGFGGEPGNAFYNDVFDSKSIDVDGKKVGVAQGHNSSNINEAKQMMQLDIDEGKSDVIPSLPSSTDKKSDNPKK